MALLQAFLGSMAHWQGPDSALIHEHIGCVSPQLFIADITGVMVALVFVVSTQQTFVKNENLKKTEPCQQCPVAIGPYFGLLHPCPSKTGILLRRGGTLVFFGPISASSQPYEIIPIPFLLLF